MSDLNQDPSVDYSEPAVAVEEFGTIIAKSKHRKIVYGVYVAASFVTANLVVAYSSVDAPIPAWLKITLAIIGNSSVAFGGIAIANTKK
jgi:hypothetical protein